VFNQCSNFVYWVLTGDRILIERIIVWYCEKHGPVAKVRDRKEVARHRAAFDCKQIYDKRVYAHNTETDKWYEVDNLFRTIDEAIAFLRMTEDEQALWIAKAELGIV